MKKNPANLPFYKVIGKKVKGIIEKSLRSKLIFTFVICTVFSGLITWGSFAFISKWTSITYMDYMGSMNARDEQVWKIIDLIESNSNSNVNKSDSGSIQRIMNSAQSSGLKIIVVDLKGQVIIKSSNVNEVKINIDEVIRKALMYHHLYNKYTQSELENLEITSAYPMTLNGKPCYLVAKGILKAEEKSYIRISGWEPLALLVGLIAFITLFYFLTKRKVNYIKELSAGLLVISKGQLNYRAHVSSPDELGLLAYNINKMAEDLQLKIDREKEIEQAKTELITNVSHDLRTPLTSILGYLKLVKDKAYKNESQMENYIQIIYNKSKKLKLLIDDLFEYTKLTDTNFALRKQKICLNDLLEQFLEEFTIFCEEYHVLIIRDIPKEKYFLLADPEKMVRVFENLLTNAVRHSEKPGKIKVVMQQETHKIRVSVKNKGKEIPKGELDHLFDRFYRGDKSRAESLSGSGSGLGLAITKSIVELHGGEIQVKSKNGETTFSVELDCHF